MPSAFSITKFHNMGQDRDHQFIIFFLFAELLFNNFFKTLLACIQKHR